MATSIAHNDHGGRPFIRDDRSIRERNYGDSVQDATVALLTAARHIPSYPGALGLFVLAAELDRAESQYSTVHWCENPNDTYPRSVAIGYRAVADTLRHHARGMVHDRYGTMRRRTLTGFEPYTHVIARRMEDAAWLHVNKHTPLAHLTMIEGITRAHARGLITADERERFTV